MQSITLIAVGNVKTDWIRRGCEEYVSRLKDCNFSLVELDASKQSDASKQKEEESDRILKALEKTDGHVYVLDETGRSHTSQKFSLMISEKEDIGLPVTFVLGGAYGLDDRVLAAGELMCLSSMTFTHEMCRLIFLEQLYRARQIRRGTGYHH